MELGEPPTMTAQEAIAALEEKDWKRLTAYADFKLFGAARTLRGYSGEDLVAEAVRQTLDGTRKWNPEIDVVMHLKGCIRSIGSGLYKQVQRHPELSGVEVQAGDMTPEEADAQQILDKLRGNLRDAVTQKIFDLTLDGWSPAEIKQSLRLNDPTFAAAKKAIYRESRKLMETLKGKKK